MIHLSCSIAPTVYVSDNKCKTHSNNFDRDLAANSVAPASNRSSYCQACVSAPWRLYSLVNSLHAWISAFSKYFPRPATIKNRPENPRVGDDEERVTTEKRSFTRLSAVPS